MTTSNFISGDTVVFEISFYVSDTLTDPTEVYFKLKNPNEVTTTFQYDPNDPLSRLNKDSIGLYYINIKLSLGGQWWWRWEGVGAADGVSEGRVTVLPSQITG